MITGMEKTPTTQETAGDTTADPRDEEIEQLQDQVSTLEELLLVYEQSATERENRLQDTLRNLEERALQLQHAQLALQTVKAILHSMGDAVLVTESDGHTLFSNPAAEKLLEANVLDCPLGHFLEPASETTDEVCASAEELSLREFASGKSIDGLEIYLETQCRWLSMNARPLEAEGQSSGAVIVFRDVTRSKQIARSLHQSNEEFRQQSQVLANTLRELKQAQAMLIHEEKMASLGQTVAGIAHEINNPVSFIHGNIEITRQIFEDLLRLVYLFQQTYPNSTLAIDEAIESLDLDFVAEDFPRMMASMSAGTERIREIVKSLRVFSRLDEAALKAVDIHAGLDSSCLMVQSQLAARADCNVIALRKNYGTLPLFECHASQLNQVFVHLLNNAIYAIHSSDRQVDSPEVVIQTEALTDKIVIQVSDNGGGIPKSVQSKIFDPFFTTKPVGQGAGLGLSICHQIVVDIHRGSIDCTSKEGVGTVFEIALPYRQQY